MAGATNENSAKAKEIGLVLQGGGALGAYEWGGIIALLDVLDQAESKGKRVTLRVVTGVSIGAINAACVVGAATRAKAREQLSGMWNAFTIKDSPFLPSALTFNLPLLEVPHFYRFSPGWNFTYLYQTSELLQTLGEHVNFAALNTNKTAFVVTAVDVLGGELTWFANQAVGKIKPTTITPKHVLASGSLPPQFPWTAIGQRDNARNYWDGGVIDNTPLGTAIDAFTPGNDVSRFLVVMNLFPTKATQLPASHLEVVDRLNQLRFGNRLHQDCLNADQINDLLATIETLVARLPNGIPAELRSQVENARKLKSVQTIEILLPPAAQSANDQNGFRDFSNEGVRTRRQIGQRVTFNTLKQHFPDILAA
jgi:NTE family protein